MKLPIQPQSALGILFAALLLLAQGCDKTGYSHARRHAGTYHVHGSWTYTLNGDQTQALVDADMELEAIEDTDSLVLDHPSLLAPVAFRVDRDGNWLLSGTDSLDARFHGKDSFHAEASFSSNTLGPAEWRWSYQGLRQD